MSDHGQKIVPQEAVQYQPASFEFTSENVKEAKKIIAKYPKGKQQSAIMPLLTMAQKQHQNWLPRAAMDYVANMLEVPPMRVYEVATFYTMYNLKPVGKHFIEVCTTTPCWLRGSDEIVKTCKKELGINVGETTEDGEFTLVEVECLCACVNAPMVQIGEHYYEDLTADSMREMIRKMKRGEALTPGPQSERRNCEPASGQTTLLNVPSAKASQSQKKGGTVRKGDENKPIARPKNNETMPKGEARALGTKQEIKKANGKPAVKKTSSKASAKTVTKPAVKTPAKDKTVGSPKKAAKGPQKETTPKPSAQKKPVSKPVSRQPASKKSPAKKKK